MARNDKWIARQIKNSDKELNVDVDTDQERAQLDRMASIHARQVEELRSNPTVALALISAQKVYFTAEELYLAYGKNMKPVEKESADKMKPENLTEYADIATNTDEEFWEEVSKIEGHWTSKRT